MSGPTTGDNATHVVPSAISKRNWPRPWMALLVLALLTPMVSVSDLSPSIATAGESAPSYISPSIPYSDIHRTASGTAWGPPVNEGLNCGSEAEPKVCRLKLTFTRSAEWANFGAKMIEAGVSALTVRLADCPTDRPRTQVMTTTSASSSVTIECGFGQYHTVPSLDARLLFEWHYPAAQKYVQAGAVVPIATPPHPYTYVAGAPVVETKRTLTGTASGPPQNQGVNCGGISPTACYTVVRFELAPGWGDWKQFMIQNGYQYGRVTIASKCPGDANDGYTTSLVLATGSWTFSPTRNHKLGCDFGRNYTIPSEHVSWTFEWKRVGTADWVYGGSQLTADERSEAEFPDLEIAGYAALLAGVPLSRVCEPLLFSPSPRLFSSVPSEYMACQAMATSGKYTTSALLAAMAVTYGVITLDVLAGPDAPTTSSPPVIAPVLKPPRTTPAPNPLPPPVVLPESGSIPIEKALVQRDPALSPSHAAQVAQRCRELVAEARLKSVAEASGVLRHPCELLPIYVPGSDAVAAATHKARSILANPETVLLHNASSAENPARVLAEGYVSDPWVVWRQLVPPGHDAYTSVGGTLCVPNSMGYECDEYPYNASKEGGPHGPPSDPNLWHGFTLDLIPTPDNQADGLAFTRFKSDLDCGLVEPSPPYAAIPDVPFLVIPMPYGPPSTHFCQG